MSDILKENQNTGYKHEIFPTDRIAAVAGPSPRLFKGVDLRPFRSSNQWQTGRNGDKQHCVSRADCNCMECWLNFLYQNNLMPKVSRAFLEQNNYIKDGKVELHVRFLAVMSGTTKDGNSISKVSVTGRQLGYAPSNFPGYADDVDLTWDEYYDMGKVPQAIKNLALEFKKHFEKTFDWILTGSQKFLEQDRLAMMDALEQGVLQVAAATCSPWSAETPPACSLTAPTHSFTVDHIEHLKEVDAFDHYEVFAKKLPYNYIIPYAMKHVVTCIASDGVAPLIPLTGVGTIMKKNDTVTEKFPGLYMFMHDTMWHPFDAMDICTAFNGKYDPSKTLRVDQLPSNIGFLITKGGMAVNVPVADSAPAAQEGFLAQLIRKIFTPKQ